MDNKAVEKLREQIATYLYEKHHPRMFTTFEELESKYHNSAEAIKQEADYILTLIKEAGWVSPEVRKRDIKGAMKGTKEGMLQLGYLPSYQIGENEQCRKCTREDWYARHAYLSENIEEVK